MPSHNTFGARGPEHRARAREHIRTAEEESRALEEAKRTALYWRTMRRRYTFIRPRVGKVEKTPQPPRDAWTPKERTEDLKQAVGKVQENVPPQPVAPPEKAQKKEKKEKPNIQGATLRGMGNEAPDDTTPEDLMAELEDAFGSIVPHGEAAKVEGWMPDHQAERRSAIFTIDTKSKKPCLTDPETGEVIAREGDKGTEHIPWRSEVLGEGTAILIEKDEATGVWSVVQQFGKEGSHTAETEMSALLELGVSKVFPKEVQAEVERDKALGVDALVAREANRLERLKPTGKNWKEKYRIGKNRIDVTELETITIDPETAMDFDDALSLRRISKKGDKDEVLEVWVHSASPLDFAGANSASFQEAMRRGTSVYIKGTVIPMLPPFYSGGVDTDGAHHEGVMSLVEGKERLTNSIVFTFVNGKLVEDPPPFKAMSVIKSRKRFSYEEAQRVADGTDPHPHKGMLQTLMRLSKDIRKARQDAGQISLPEREEWNVERDENGLERLVHKERNEMMKIIEDFMILANNAQGKRLLEFSEKYGDLPGVFRVHEAPSMSELRDAAVAMGETGIARTIDAREQQGITDKEGEVPFATEVLLRFLDRLKASPETRKNIAEGVDIRIRRGELRKEQRQSEISRLIKEWEKEYEKAYMPIIMRLVTAAYVSSEPKGHFFIGSPSYTWWTSPMRRATDILVELIDRSAQYKEQGTQTTPFAEEIGKELPDVLEHISEQGYKAKQIEFESLRRYATHRLKPLVGQTLTIRLVRAKVSDGVVEKILVRVPIKGTQYEQDFFLPIEEVSGFPEDIKELRALRGEIKVKLNSVDVRHAMINISYQGKATLPEQAPRAPRPRNRRRRSKT